MDKINDNISQSISLGVCRTENLLIQTVHLLDYYAQVCGAVKNPGMGRFLQVYEKDEGEHLINGRYTSHLKKLLGSGVDPSGPN